MNLNRLINMVIHSFIRQIMNRGVNSAFNAFDKRSERKRREQEQIEGDQETDEGENHAASNNRPKVNIDRRKIRTIRRRF